MGSKCKAGRTAVRNTNIELLRFALMCFILFWHVIVHGYDMKSIGQADFVMNGNFYVHAFFMTLFVPATYTFVFISGYYGIRFTLKGCLKLILWCTAVSLLYYVYDRFCRGEAADFKEYLLPLLWGGKWWWFMTEYFLLYVLSPMLNKGFDSLERKGKNVMLLFLFLYSALGIPMLQSSCGSSFSGILCVYLIARYSANYSPPPPRKCVRWFAVSFVSLFALASVAYLLMQLTGKRSFGVLVFSLYSYINPLVITMAAMTFFLVKGLPEYRNSWLNRLLAPNLFIYLIAGNSCFVANECVSNEALAAAFSENFMLGLGECLAIIIACLAGGHLISAFSAFMLKALRV